MDDKIKKYLADIIKAIDEIDITLNDKGRSSSIIEARGSCIAE